MKHRFSVYNLEEVREQIAPPFRLEGIMVVLAHGPKMRFHVTRNDDDVYFGIVEDGKPAVLNIITGEFNVTE